MCYTILYDKAVPELQEWFLHHVRYHIDHKVVPELQNGFYMMCYIILYHKAVPELQEWFLYYVLYYIVT